MVVLDILYLGTPLDYPDSWNEKYDRNLSLVRRSYTGVMNQY